MQTSANMSVLLRGKRFFLILGLIFLLVGFSLIVVYSFAIKPDMVLSESVQMTTTGDYVSPTFHAQQGDWLEFALMSSNSSVLRLRSSLHGEAWRIDNFNQQAAVNGAVYNFTSYINVTDDYTLSLENFAAHCYYPYLSNYEVCIDDNNTFSGSFYLMRTPTYSPEILLSGEALLLASCGLLLIPTLAYFRIKAKRFGMTL